MNRRQRRAQRFVAPCSACGKDCAIHALKPRAIYEGDPTAPDDLGICKGCPCSAGMCDACGESDGHWLGCPVVGLPEMPPEAKVTVLQ